MIEQLDREKTSELEQNLGRLEALLDERIVESGEVEPQGVTDDDGTLKGLRYSAMIGEDDQLGGHIWRSADVFVPEDSEQKRRYALQTQFPIDGPLIWEPGDKTVSYEEVHPTEGSRTRDADAVLVRELTDLVKDGELIDASRFTISQTKDTQLNTHETVEPVKDDRPVGFGRRVLRALGRGR